MKSPSLSIVIPSYNRAPLVHRAVQSARRQLQSNDRIIVVDDGSTDNTSSMLATLYGGDPFVQIYTLGFRHRMMRARIFGVKQSETDWVCFLDSDDYYMDGSLEIIRHEIDLYKEKYPLIQFKTVAVVKGGTYEQRGYCPDFDWHTYSPSKEDVLFKRHIFGDMHRCFNREFFLKYPYHETNPDSELSHYVWLAQMRVPTIYINKPVVYVDETGPDRYSSYLLRERASEYQRLYLYLIRAHFMSYVRYPLELRWVLNRILWLQSVSTTPKTFSDHAVYFLARLVRRVLRGLS
jgi:glycosyltransferase involved in cell wall biosynthesis